MEKQAVMMSVGELLWDRLPGGKQIGGAPANVVYHASCLGADGYVVSAVGKDKLGDELINSASKTNLHTIIERVDYPTGTVRVTLSSGIPEYQFVENVAWDHIPLTDTALSLIKKADVVCYGTLASRNEVSRKTITTLLKNANPSSLRLFDINLRSEYYSKELIRELIKYANVFKLNNTETVVVKSMLDVDMSDDSLCRMILEKYNLKYLIYTNGGISSSIYTKDTVSTLKTPHVRINDTIGAGDAFSGAFLYYTLSGCPLEDAHRMAVNISAFVCTQSGAWPEYPETIEEYI